MSNLMQVEQSAVHPSIFTDYESSTIRRAFKIIEKKRIKQEPILCYLEDFRDYLILRFAGLTNEQHHTLYLDTNRRLLDVDIDSLGDQKSVSYNIRNITLKAISLGAEHVVFAHNHPSDNPTPSDADMCSLIYTSKILSPLNINVLESFVVTSDRITSIKKYVDELKEQEWEERRRLDEEKSRVRRKKLAVTRARKVAEKKLAEQGVIV